MKTLATVFLVAMIFCLANSPLTADSSPTDADHPITINPKVTYGTWDGWGVSLSWWANVFGDRDDLADIVFTTNYTTLNGVSLPGLGMNIVRYNVGGCSSNSIGDAAMQVSPRIPPFRQIYGFWENGNSTNPASTSWNWSADANQRAMLLKAKARGANLFELFSNSPMWWMCANHNPSGADLGTHDNLQPENYRQHAIYLATVAKYAKENWNLTFNSVEAFNEPDAHWWTSSNNQEGCHFNTDAQAKVITYLREELDQRELTSVDVAASDENTYDSARSTWKSFNLSVKEKIGRVNVHGYQYAKGRRDLLYASVAGKKIWNSEYGDGDATGMLLAGNLNLDLHWLHPTGWCYWQPFDGHGWGLIQSTLGNKQIGKANPKYFVLAQYTRHIRPGMTILDGGDQNTVAAYDSSKQKLVVVTANFKTDRWITYNLTNFPNASGPIQRWMTVVTGAKYQFNTDVTIDKRSFRVWFPKNSVQTFEIYNVNINTPVHSDQPK